MLSKRRYERDMKNRIASTLDSIKESRDDGAKRIGVDEELRTLIKRNVRQNRSLLYDITPDDSESLVKELASFLKSDKTDLKELLSEFLAMNDANFDTRYAWFYDHIATKIVLYRYQIGDYITVTARGRTGFAKSVNLKIYGTFTFDSLEKSQLAGAFHIIDMISFRELYGRATSSERAEMKTIADEMGVEDLDEEEAIAKEFGGEDDVVSEGDDAAAAAGFDEFAEATIAGRRQEALAEQDKPYTQEEMDAGLAEHAAVLLHDHELLEATSAAIAAKSAELGLGVQTSPWDEASGIIGGFTQAIQVALFVIIFIIFVVVLIIINNSIVMATMDRTQEIGTIRAIGGQRILIIKLFIGEAMVLGVLAATVGVLLGALLIAAMNSGGIPAGDPILYFMFGGPRLYPTLSVFHPVIAGSTVLIVTFVATLYPAWLAARIEPIVAMAGKD